MSIQYINIGGINIFITYFRIMDWNTRRLGENVQPRKYRRHIYRFCFSSHESNKLLAKAIKLKLENFYIKLYLKGNRKSNVGVVDNAGQPIKYQAQLRETALAQANFAINISPRIFQTTLPTIPDQSTRENPSLRQQQEGKQEVNSITSLERDFIFEGENIKIANSAKYINTNKF